MKHLIVTSLALFIGIFVGFGISYTVRQPETAPAIRQNEKPDTAVGIGEPVIIFAPGGLFSAEEKNKLTRDVTQPLMIYHQTAAEPLVSVFVQKPDGASETVNVLAIRQNGAYAEFSHRTADRRVPECFDQSCGTIPEKLRTLYPALYQEELR